MKKIALIVIVVFTLSCNDSIKTKYYDLGELISSCDGFAVVASTGVNNGNTKPYRNFIVVIDGNGVCREYCGAKYNVSKGDTLMIK